MPSLIAGIGLLAVAACANPQPTDANGDPHPVKIEVDLSAHTPAPDIKMALPEVEIPALRYENPSIDFQQYAPEHLRAAILESQSAMHVFQRGLTNEDSNSQAFFVTIGVASLSGELELVRVQVEKQIEDVYIASAVNGGNQNLLHPIAGADKLSFELQDVYDWTFVRGGRLIGGLTERADQTYRQQVREGLR